MSALELLKAGRKRIQEDTTYKVMGNQGVSLMEAAVEDVKTRPGGAFTRDEKEAMKLLAKGADDFDALHHDERGIDLRVRRLAIYDAVILKLESGNV
jgi:hypothetical protein